MTHQLFLCKGFSRLSRSVSSLLENSQKHKDLKSTFRMIGINARRIFMASALLLWNLFVAVCRAQTAGDFHTFDLSTNNKNLNGNWFHDYDCEGVVRRQGFIRAVSHVARWDPVTPAGPAWVATSTETGDNDRNYRQYQFIIQEDKETKKINLVMVYVLWNSYKNFNDGKQCRRVG